jgi:hypothetical protein
MTDDERKQEGAEEEIEDLEAAAGWADVAGGIQCHLPTVKCSNPSCTSQTYCKPGTLQGCQTPTCRMTTVEVA